MLFNDIWKNVACAVLVIVFVVQTNQNLGCYGFASYRDGFIDYARFLGFAANTVIEHPLLSAAATIFFPIALVKLSVLQVIAITALYWPILLGWTFVHKELTPQPPAILLLALLAASMTFMTHGAKWPRSDENWRAPDLCLDRLHFPS